MKLCCFCVHFNLDMGHPPYSELTPGDDAEINCTLGKWEMRNSNGAITYRRYIIMAQKCKDFKPAKE